MSLDSYTSTTPPPGTQLRWSTLSNPLNENAYLTPAQVDNPPNDGSYFGFFLDDNGTPNDFTDDCASEVMEVELTLNTSPTLSNVTDGEACGPGSVVLSATGSPGATVNWYASIDIDTPLATGTTFNTPTIQTTTTFYVQAIANGCTSDRVAVEALVGNEATTGTVTDASACSIPEFGGSVVDLDDRISGASAGNWTITTDPSGSLVINADNEVDFEGLVGGNYVFTYTTTTATAPCVDQTADITIFVSDCNVDDDNDGLLTGEEVNLDLDPNNPDTDGDGINDGDEVGPDIANPLDEDGDGIIDALDSNSLDTDGDGVNDQQDPANDNPCIPDNSSVDCPVDIEVNKSADVTSALVGETVVFTVTVTNLTDKPADTVIIGDLLETGFEFQSQSVSLGTYDETTGEWIMQDFPALGTQTMTLTVTVLEDGVYTNTAQLLSSTPLDDNPANDVSETITIDTVVPEGVDLIVEKRRYRKPPW